MNKELQERFNKAMQGATPLRTAAPPSQTQAPTSTAEKEDNRNIFEKLLIEQANRLSNDSEITKEDLMTITEADVLAARASDTQLAKAELNRKMMEESTQNAIEELQKLI